MAGTIEGARKTKEKILARDPDFYKRNGAIGGRLSNTGGFASNKVGRDGLTGRTRAVVAGRKGGVISRRRPSKKAVDAVEDTQGAQDGQAIQTVRGTRPTTPVDQAAYVPTKGITPSFLSGIFHKTKG